MDMLTEKQEQVFNVLLLPIQCNDKSAKLLREVKTISTGQKYYSCCDEDMSDFAIDFYKIIYKKILVNGMLNENGRLINIEFAGDTMNSFNSIANVTPGAGNSVKNRTKYSEWPIFLQNYHDHYHCLANFWVIPMKIGRKSMKFNRYDSLDVCVGILEECYKKKMGKFNSYFKQIRNFDSFNEIHFLPKLHSKTEILDSYKNKYAKEGEKLIEFAMSSMRERAYNIATSEYSNDLWEYFNKMNLL